MYFLRSNYKYADNDLYPSLFYILNWIEHDERYYPDEQDYYYR